jgi:hypothetical protein
MVLVANVYKEDQRLILEEHLADLSASAERQGFFKQHSHFSLEEGRAFWANGKQLSEEEAWAHITKGKTVLLGWEERALAPHWLRPLKEDTIILIGRTASNPRAVLSP